jgi:hypothetical protein
MPIAIAEHTHLGEVLNKLENISQISSYEAGPFT